MKHIHLLLSVFLFLSTAQFVWAENRTLGELQSAASKAEHSSAYLDVCEFLVESGEVSDLFALNLDKGYRAALREKNALSIARYYDLKAEYGMLRGELEHYMEHKQKAYGIYEKLNRRSDLANSCIYIGNYFNATGQYDSAIIYLTRMQPYARQHHEESSYHIMLSCLADTYYRIGEKDSAIHYETLSTQVSKYCAILFICPAVIGHSACIIAHKVR